jgi:hypothetical protein
MSTMDGLSFLLLSFIYSWLSLRRFSMTCTHSVLPRCLYFTTTSHSGVAAGHYFVAFGRFRVSLNHSLVMICHKRVANTHSFVVLGYSGKAACQLLVSFCRIGEGSVFKRIPSLIEKMESLLPTMLERCFLLSIF